MSMSLHRKEAIETNRLLNVCGHQRPLAGAVAMALAWMPLSSVAAAAAAPALVSPASAMPSTDPGYVEFSGAFVAPGSSTNLSRFESGVTVLPGTYNVDVYVNDNRIARRNVVFRSVDGERNAQPCFSVTEFGLLGVDTDKLDPSMVDAADTCFDIRQAIPTAAIAMDAGALRLDVTIPQASMVTHARGYVDPKLWDQGSTALLLGYNFNAYSSRQDLGSRADNGARRDTYANTNAYLGLNLGLNVAGWRLRNVDSAQWDKTTKRTQWRTFNTTATHDITPWKAQLTLGDSSTQGVLFDSTAFRGMTIYSDDRMLPDSQRGFAPVVRGMANTQARVEVRQQGNLLLETTVAPGPFVIDDLYATGYGGDLSVTIIEADGARREFTVPYASVPMLLRPGINRWSVTNGQYRDGSLRQDKPYYLEGTYQRGVNNWVTVYAGVQSTYRALYKGYMAGAAFNSPIGAVALDVTNAHTNVRSGGRMDSRSGYSSRVSYSNAIYASGTSFTAASYRYSNKNFYTLSDAVRHQDASLIPGDSSNRGDPRLLRARRRFQVTVNQTFGPKFGSLYFTGMQNSYWNGVPKSTTYQLGYSNSYRSINYGVNASSTYSDRPQYRNARIERQFGINVSIPLGGPSSRRMPTFSVSAVHDDVTGGSGRLGVNGTFGEQNQFNYNAAASRSDRAGASNTFSGNMGWQATYGSINSSYSRSSGYQQGSISATGGAVVHGGGITLAPMLDINGPIAIIQAPEAKGARVSSSGKARIDRRGYAVATSLMPYRKNDVTLDPTSTSMDVELQTTRQVTAPRAGAVIPLTFNTVSGRSVLIRVKRDGDAAIPFGTEVLNAQGQSVGIVGQGSTLFVRGAEEGESLHLRWGDDASEQCQLSYQLLPRAPAAAPFVAVDASCH